MKPFNMTVKVRDLSETIQHDCEGPGSDHPYISEHPLDMIKDEGFPGASETGSYSGLDLAGLFISRYSPCHAKTGLEIFGTKLSPGMQGS